jgi:hypothetical protein
MTCWACLVGLSGSGKTPALDTVKRVLSLIERNRRGEISALQLAHETRVEIAKAALKKWKDEVSAAIENGQPPPPKPAEALDVGPFVAPRLYVNDATIERLAPLLEARPHGGASLLTTARLSSTCSAIPGPDREFWLCWTARIHRRGAGPGGDRAALSAGRSERWFPARQAVAQFRGRRRRHLCAIPLQLALRAGFRIAGRRRR